MRSLVIMLIFSGSAMDVIGQLDSIYSLPEATVKANLVPSTDLYFDSTHLEDLGQANLTELLQLAPNTFVRNYGPGSLGTLTMGGGSAAQTDIRWEGISIRNPMLGQIDVTLVPGSLFTQIHAQSTGGSALYGNNQLTGGIELESSISVSDRLQVDLESGSWNRWGGLLKASYGLGKVRTATSAYGLRASNDFLYQLREEEVRLDHASIRNLGVYHQMESALGSKSTLKWSAWWQLSDQEIPPTTVQNSSEAEQKTQSFRSSLQYGHQGDGHRSELTLGYTAENISFVDPAMFLETDNRYGSLQAAARRTWISNTYWSATAGLDFRHFEARSGNYSGTIGESQWEVYSGITFNNRKWKMTVQGRQGWYASLVAPLTALAELTYMFSPRTQIGTSLSRDLRYPTLNERFWIPGGKEDLSAERGWSKRAFFNSVWSGQGLTLIGKLHVFDRLVDDWILWSPLEGAGFWAPNNLIRVRSSGGGAELAAQHESNDTQLELRAGHTITRSVNEIAVDIPRLDAGEQLWYTPRHRTVARLLAKRPQWRLQFAYHFTGGYQGVLSALDGYGLTSLTLSHRLQVSDLAARIWLRVLNLTNAEYRVIERRPMPGRNFRIGLKVTML